ncbi:MAG: TlyA family RNA methyltransferase [Ruminococcaceae bacterium]|nr:TlyA family RNA methyltransferase [Oscillospiraceae bacterium]
MRADLYLVQNGYADSRTLAQKLIADGAVTVDGRVLRKASEEVAEGEHAVAVRATADTRYVGRGGLKLEAALTAFPVDVRGCVAADIGASTGGFTDCLLQNGTERVYAVDSGHGQLHPRLLADPRVRSAEGMNARNLTPADLMGVEAAWQTAHPSAEAVSFDGLVDGIVMDVSFISQALLHPALSSILRTGGWMISLIKPQFELTKKALNKQGIVKQEKDCQAAVDKVLASAVACGFEVVSVIPSPIEGGDGNREFLAYLRKKI